jgi:hypothetical protein
MGIKELLNSKYLDLPKVWNNSFDSYYDYLVLIFTDFENELNKLKGSEEITKSIISNIRNSNDLAKTILNVIEEYYKGKTYNAYDLFKKELIKQGKLFENLYKSPFWESTHEYLYRFRKGDFKEKTRKDIFHTPFQDRHKVKTSRYSIPGLPCLYLGGSLYICWEEMDRINFDDVRMARFSAEDYLLNKVLDLGFRPNHLYDIWENNIARSKFKDDFVLSQIIFWPLIASCSIEVRDKDDPFKPEYIIPQLLMQWISENDNIYGIRYFSVRAKGSFDDYQTFLNYVFPVKSFKSKGYCDKLINRFKFTIPFNWRLLDLQKNPKKGNCINENSKIRLEVGNSLNYGGTEFGEKEKILNAKRLQKLKTK